ncbi:redoxin domain-containing protein [Streptomyces sp. GC420]|uniref:redoxin domain-containing protein n=1 Tax=Streptomyces sp. GC420 TaxID=2697568 RepID=UPI001414CC9A|nr:redoxin domain-containing protein [Streptomyces sp. GC420]NBM14645.1 redoxin domain-containing protein [Streptomyces sp. GC420]
MSNLVAAVAAVFLLCLLNLVFALGIVRRLREHSERLAQLDGPGRGAPDHAILPPGAIVGAFGARPNGAGPVTHEDLADGTLVAFFSPTCKPCNEKLPGFAAALAQRPEERGRVLAVVVGDPAASAPMVAALEAVALVVQEPDDGPVATAFAIRAFPTCARVSRDSDGRLTVTETDTWPRTASRATA